MSEGVAKAVKPQTLDHHRTLLNLDRGTMQDEAATSKNLETSKPREHYFPRFL